MAILGPVRPLHAALDMLAVMARHLAAENRAQKALAKGVDFIEHKRGTGPGGGGDSLGIGALGGGSGIAGALINRSTAPLHSGQRLRGLSEKL